MNFNLKKNILVLFCFVSFLSTAHELDSLLKVLPRVKNEKSKIELWEKIINISIWQTTDKERKSYIDDLWNYSQKRKNEYGIATANLSYAKYFERRQELEKAKMYAKKAYNSFEKQKNKLGLCKVLRQQSYNAFKASNMELATKLAYKALKITTSIKDRLQEAWCISLTGVLVFDSQPKESIKLQSKALEILLEIDAKREASIAALTLSTFYLNSREDAKSKENMALFFKLQEDLNDIGLLAEGNANAAVVYNAIGMFDKAEKFMAESGKYYLQLNSPVEQALYFRMKGVFYRESGKYQKAIEAAKKGLLLLNGINGLDTEKGKLQYTLFVSYKALKKYEEAITAYEEAINHEFNLYDTQTSYNIAELKEKYETEKKEQENKTLKQINKVNELEISKKESKVNEQRYIVILLILLVFSLSIGFLFYRKSQSLKKEKIKRKLEQQVFRTQMNPHFLFNSLNSIQRMYVEGNENDANEYMADFAELMRRILDNSTQNTISLYEELAALKLYLNLEQIRCKGKVSYTIHVDENIDVYHTLVPPLVIQPFVENAIWHGILPKNEKGHISITLSQQNDQIKCDIHDDGVGFSVESKSKHESKGIKITEQRIGNKIVIKSIPNEGTTVSFYINN